MKSLPSICGLLLAFGCNTTQFKAEEKRTTKKTATPAVETPPRLATPTPVPEAKDKPVATDDGGGDDLNADDGNGDDGAGNDDGETPPAEPSVEEKEIIETLPGLPVLRTGVNFEDLGLSGDKDFNDAVLCFEGKFKVDGSNVASIAAQTVEATTSSHSGCRHEILVEITHADGSKEAPITYDSRSGRTVLMNFKVGSRLEVFMTPYEGCSPGVKKSMHDAVAAKVLPNVCNTTGN